MKRCEACAGYGCPECGGQMKRESRMRFLLHHLWCVIRYRHYKKPGIQDK